MQKADGPGQQGADSHWFEPIARHAAETYLRYSFTKGTANEVAFLVEVLGLSPGDRVLDVGCGPGRHVKAFAERGIEAVGVDISAEFIAVAERGAPPGATFVRGDARNLPPLGMFDAVISLCQGGFGLPKAAEREDTDLLIMQQMAGAVRADGTLVLSAFSAYFQMRWLEDSDSFDADRGVNHERTAVKDADGVDANFDLWTRCFTPPELRLLCRAAGLSVVHLWSVTPGDYGRYTPTVDRPEFLLVARGGVQGAC